MRCSMCNATSDDGVLTHELGCAGETVGQKRAAAAVTADTITAALVEALAERTLYIVEPQHPTMGEIALEHYGIQRACDAVALQGDDLAAFGARLAEIWNARHAKDGAA